MGIMKPVIDIPGFFNCCFYAFPIRWKDAGFCERTTIG